LSDDGAHALIPLALAVGVVRNKAYDDRQVTNQGREGDLNMLAGFIAATVPLYEYTRDPSDLARAIPRWEIQGGMFRDGGRVLRFVDGRSAKRDLAVNATDIACVVALLKDPQHSVMARSRFARRWAQEVKAYSIRLKEQATELRRVAHQRREAQQLRFRPAGAKAGQEA
jgi:hypothetical protein